MSTFLTGSQLYIDPPNATFTPGTGPLTGTVSNSGTSNVEAQLIFDTSYDSSNKYFELDGTGDLIYVPSTGITGQNLSLWAFMNGILSRQQTLITTAKSGQGVSIGVTNTDEIVITFGTSTAISTGHTYTGGWQMFMVTVAYNSSNLNYDIILYNNSTAVFTSTVSSYTASSTGLVYLGTARTDQNISSSDSTYEGDIGHFGMKDGAFTSNEVSSIFSFLNEVYFPSQNLVPYYISTGTMSVYPPPKNVGGEFNSDLFWTADGDKANFPTLQGTLTCPNGLKFGDGTFQNSASTGSSLTIQGQTTGLVTNVDTITVTDGTLTAGAAGEAILNISGGAGGSISVSDGTTTSTGISTLQFSDSIITVSSSLAVVEFSTPTLTEVMSSSGTIATAGAGLNMAGFDITGINKLACTTSNMVIESTSGFLEVDRTAGEGTIRLKEGTRYVGLKPPTTVSTSYDISLPDAPGLENSALICTSNSGDTGWEKLYFRNTNNTTYSSLLTNCQFFVDPLNSVNVTLTSLTSIGTVANYSGTYADNATVDIDSQLTRFFKLDGTGDVLDFPTSPTTGTVDTIPGIGSASPENFNLFAWFNVAATTNESIISTRVSSAPAGTDGGIQFAIQSGSYKVLFGIPSNSTNTVTGPTKKTGWEMVAITGQYDSNSNSYEVKIYQDGVLATTATGINYYAADSGILIGVNRADAAYNTGTVTIDGQIGHFGITGGATLFSDADITSIYNELKSYYTFAVDSITTSTLFGNVVGELDGEVKTTTAITTAGFNGTTQTLSLTTAGSTYETFELDFTTNNNRDLTEIEFTGTQRANAQYICHITNNSAGYVLTIPTTIAFKFTGVSGTNPALLSFTSQIDIAQNEEAILTIYFKSSTKIFVSASLFA